MIKRAPLLRLALVMAIGCASPALAARSQAIKAAFLPKFARYITWPAPARAAGTPLTICVVGSDQFGRALRRAATAERGGARAIAVRDAAVGPGLAGCNMAFVSGDKVQETLAALAHIPVVTVTEDPAGPHRGIIHFTNRANRVRFAIDQRAAGERGLEISSQLLDLAVEVEP
jgi:hypothetical protein